MTIIELFAGIGTQLHALKEVYPEVESLGISEIDVKPLRAYEALLGHPNNFGDILILSLVLIYQLLVNKKDFPVLIHR